MSYDQDPFEDPTPRMASHPSAYSFRGRLIMIEPREIERNVPKQAAAPNGPKGDKVIADVTVLDGNGPIEIYDGHFPSGRKLDGPVFRKCWFGQDQIVEALQTPDGKSLRGRVLCKIETLKPGVSPAGQGNPWTVTAATPTDKQAAAAELARIIMGQEQEEESPF
jgi:hypothetical protein